MNTKGFFNYNGKIYSNDVTVISPDNRSFRYGDGFFETMKVMNGQLLLKELHVERITASLQKLSFEESSFFHSDDFIEEILSLTDNDKCNRLARVRVNFFRGNGGLYDAESMKINYIIQAWAANDAVNRFNENGLVMDVYTEARKACDAFSHLKNNNYLSYVMAALWAKENKLNDAVLLNNYNRIADSTIANIFIVKDGTIKTPALTEGCIAGVMRNYLLRCMRKEGLPIEETQIDVDDLTEASELFVTNVMQGIRWIKQMGNTNYNKQLSLYLFQKYVEPLYE